MCPGVLVGARGESRCGCPHHDGEEITPKDIHRWCTKCGNADPSREKTTGTDGLVCADRTVCDTEYRYKLETNPAWARMVERRAENDRRKAELVARESAAGAGKSGRDKVGRCHWSGDPTRGGKFLPGNDAKLKSLLVRLGKSGDLGAIAELLYRDWPHQEEDYTPYLYRDAQELNNGEDADQWFDARIEKRWAAIESGRTPEQAVRGRAEVVH